MAERHTHGDAVERDHSMDPQTPPRHVVEPDVTEAPASPVGVAGMWYMLGPLMLIVVVIAVGAYFWFDNRTVDREEPPTIGTVGERGNDDSTPGGGNPAPDMNSTGSELEYRGGTTAGQDINLQNVQVLDVSGSTFWVQHGAEKIAVIAPDDAPAVRKGAHVDVRVTVERDGQTMRIRASEVNSGN